jgi:hypothetical protein
MHHKNFMVHVNPFGLAMVVKRVHYRSASAVSNVTCPFDRCLPIIPCVSPELSLLNFALQVSRELNAHLLQVDYGLGRFFSESFCRVLICKVIAAFNRVIHVPYPIVLLLVSKASRYAALRSN